MADFSCIQPTILEETMLDLLLLSRARYIAGSMYGNMPRVALQLRPTAPGDVRLRSGPPGARPPDGLVHR